MIHAEHSLSAMAAAPFIMALASCAASPPCAVCDTDRAAQYDIVKMQIRHQNPAYYQCDQAALSSDAAVPMPGAHAPEKTMAAAWPPRLHIVRGDGQALRAVILVGGIHDTYHYFDPWTATLAAADTLVLGWVHSHRATPMAGSAQLLARDLVDLRAAGITDLTVVAHSIGGLVAKGAIDTLARNNQAHAFARLDLHAFGAPWGGFTLLNLVFTLPGAAAMSRAFGYPMARELLPASDFLAGLAQAMPGNGALHLYVGQDDRVALPLYAAARQRYASTAATAASLTTIEHVAHNDYRHAAALAQLVLSTQAARTHCADDVAQVRPKPYLN